MPALGHRHVADPGLGPREVAAFAASTAGVSVSLGEAHLAAVRRAHESLVAARTGGAVYGLTTGVGALRGVTVEEESGTEHALRLWRSHAGGFGPELDDGLARATMLVRLHQLLRGGSGASPALVSGLASALEAGAVPPLHTYGGVGTADLTTLAELGLTLAGELPWRIGALPPVAVAESDALPFLSSNALTATVGSVAFSGLSALSRATEQVAALSHLALRGSLQAYDPRVFAGKDDPHAAGVGERLTALLGGPTREAVRVQDPFGLRTVPQVHGAWEEALTAVERALAAEIGAAAENPLVVDDALGGTALHHGQFMTQRLAACLDAARAATVPAATLSTARLGGLLDPSLTGLPAFLADGPAGSSGLMILEYVAADLLARVRALATPVTAARTVLSLGLEEHASHATQSAWAGHELAALLPDLLACELVAAVRALRLDPSRLAVGSARDLFARADAALPDVRPDHLVGPELEAASALLRTL